MKFLTANSADIENALSNILPSGGSSNQTNLAEIFGSWESLSAFLGDYQVLLTLGTVLLSAALIAAMILRRRAAKNPPDPMKTFGADTFFKVMALILIGGLMASDLFAVYNMFENFRLRGEEALVFSITFALFLEGFPFALGFIDPLKKDPAQFVMGRGRRYRMLSAICWTFLIISWGLAIVIRLMYTEQPTMGGIGAFYNGEYNSELNRHANNSYLAQVFLFVSPILTSILAYVLSYLTFGSSCIQEAAKMLRAAHDRYNVAQQAYSKANHLRLDATSVLWSSLTGDQDAEPPLDFEDFRNQSMAYIHEMLVDGCLTAYPALLKRYNQEVEAALARYIAELAHMSSVPQLINQITVEEITREYDERMNDDLDKWAYELCEPAMRGDLEELLNNAVIGAQFRAMRKK